MSDLVGNPEDRFSRVGAHIRTGKPWWQIISVQLKIKPPKNVWKNKEQQIENILVSSTIADTAELPIIL